MDGRLSANPVHLAKDVPENPQANVREFLFVLFTIGLIRDAGLPSGKTD